LSQSHPVVIEDQVWIGRIAAIGAGSGRKPEG
jgi:hypothetical protein